MLNPLAHDFTPAPAFPTSDEGLQMMKSLALKRKEEQSKKKQPNSTKLNSKAESSSSSSFPSSMAPSVKGKQKDSQANPKKPQHRRDSKSKHRNNDSNKASSKSATTPPADLFATESKFITIEAAIDPIRRINKAAACANRLQHINSDTHQLFEHGYERYIDWIARSLRLFDTVTLVGMDNAVVDIVSMVTILQDRQLGVHDDAETFSMDIGNNRMTACIQVKLHSFCSL